MKKINQYLLERYPSIWNTKLVWMISAAAVIHLLFFVIGFFSINEQELKTSYFRIFGSYFGHPFLLNLVFSILLLVGWLTQLNKNNAFKHFYPSNPHKLFGQFAQYFVIIFASTTFFISFVMGEKVSIRLKYPESYITELKSNYLEEEKEADEDSYYDDMWGSDHYLIKNVEDAYEDALILSPFLLGNYFLLPTLFVALIVFCVRVTSLRAFLLGIVFSHVLALVLAFFSVFISIITSYDAIGYLYIFTAFAVIALTTVSLGKLPKNFIAIGINFSLIVFAPALFSLLLLFESKQLLPTATPVSYVMLLGTLAFVYGYSKFIHQWKATPE